MENLNQKIKEYKQARREQREILNNIFDLQFEIDRLEKHIENSNKNDIDKESIMRLFRWANIDIPRMIQKRMSDVEEFNESVFKERKEYFTKEINRLKTKLEIAENKTLELENRCLELEKEFLYKDISNEITLKTST